MTVPVCCGPSFRVLSCWLAAFALAVANLALHKPISDVCDWLYGRWGFALYDRVSLISIVSFSALAAVPLIARSKFWCDLSRVGALLLLLVLCAAAQQLLLVSNIELIHFPQFALLGGLLLAGGISTLPAWWLTTLCGIADEVYQFLVIYDGYPEVYLDVNDMLLNAMGASWAVLLLAPKWSEVEKFCSRTADRNSAKRWYRQRQPLRLGIAVAAFAAALYFDLPDTDPFLTVAGTGRQYRVLSVPEGLVLGAVVWWVVCWGVRGAVGGEGRLR